MVIVLVTYSVSCWLLLFRAWHGRSPGAGSGLSYRTARDGTGSSSGPAFFGAGPCPGFWGPDFSGPCYALLLWRVLNHFYSLISAHSNWNIQPKFHLKNKFHPSRMPSTAPPFSHSISLSRVVVAAGGAKGPFQVRTVLVAMVTIAVRSRAGGGGGVAAAA
jgi:hypothetical protein